MLGPGKPCCQGFYVGGAGPVALQHGDKKELRQGSVNA